MDSSGKVGQLAEEFKTLVDLGAGQLRDALGAKDPALCVHGDATGAIRVRHPKAVKVVCSSEDDIYTNED